jgi:hypothetical protein
LWCWQMEQHLVSVPFFLRFFVSSFLRFFVSSFLRFFVSSFQTQNVKKINSPLLLLLTQRVPKQQILFLRVLPQWCESCVRLRRLRTRLLRVAQCAAPPTLHWLQRWSIHAIPRIACHVFGVSSRIHAIPTGPKHVRHLFAR